MKLKSPTQSKTRKTFADAAKKGAAGGGYAKRVGELLAGAKAGSRKQGERFTALAARAVKKG